MVDKQKIDVDTVSGATNSCNVIKKAIENAIKNSKEEKSAEKIGSSR